MNTQLDKPRHVQLDEHINVAFHINIANTSLNRVAVYISVPRDRRERLRFERRGRQVVRKGVRTGVRKVVRKGVRIRKGI